MDEAAAITLAIHLLSFGRATATSIDEPFQVIGVSPEAMWVEPQDKVRSLTQRVSTVNATLSRLITDAPDFSISQELFESTIKQFEDQLLGLRREVQNRIITIRGAQMTIKGHPVTVKIAPTERGVNKSPEDDQ